MRYYCNQCNKTITAAEYKYSMKHYNRALCRTHQKNSSNTNSGNESDFGDVVSKIADSFSKVYEKGGIGLVLTILGVVMFLLFFLFRSAMQTSTFVVLVLVAAASFISGCVILYKKEQRK